MQQTIHFKNTEHSLIVFYSVRVGRKEFAKENVYTLYLSSIFVVVNNQHPYTHLLLSHRAGGKYKEGKKTSAYGSKAERIHHLSAGGCLALPARDGLHNGPTARHVKFIKEIIFLRT